MRKMWERKEGDRRGHIYIYIYIHVGVCIVPGCTAEERVRAELYSGVRTELYREVGLD